MTTSIHHSKLLLATAVLSVLALIAAPAHAVTLTDTTAGDFAAGTPGACHVGETGDGDVLLAPTEVGEFLTTDSALPGDWSEHTWCDDYPSDTDACPDGTVTVSGGVADTTGVRAHPSDPAAYGSGRSLEFVATFTAQPFQHVGFSAGDDAPGVGSGGHGLFDVFPMVMFSTNNTTTNLYARYGNGGLTDVDLGTTYIGTEHLYRIDWTATDVQFFIDGSAVTGVIPFIPSGTMRPGINDYRTAAPSVLVDWIRMTPYDSSCAFSSQVLDGGFSADWTTLSASDTTPAGTTVSYLTRTGNTPTPDGSWSLFAAVSGGNIASPNARYLQYRANLSTSAPDQTPEVEQVNVSYNACTVTGTSEALCNGVDDDCDGQIDENYVDTPTNCGVGACADTGLLQCVSGSLVDTCTPGTPGPNDATCNGIDEDCNGTNDEDYVSTPTNCGVGECADTGALVCVGGSVQNTCTPGTPVAEICNGLDDDCDGTSDDGNPGSGAFCSTGLNGVCDQGSTTCSGGVIVCVQQVFPSAEMCNGLDDDCDGSTDEGNPQGGGSCSTGNPGVCGPGTVNCLGGSLLCVPNNTSSAEVCDGADNDCDGSTDEGLGQTTCGVGECQVTVNNCVAGVPQSCTPGAPAAETCNGLDDDCDGTNDDGNPGGGGACSTGNQGICSAGTNACQAGAIVCVQNASPGPEACDDLDNDCDGTVDDACSCAAAPETGCFTAGRAQLQIKNNADPARNQLKWKWQRGVETLQTDLGDPIAATTYALCIYDTTASAASLAASVVIGPNALWQDKDPKGFGYKDKAGVEDGVQKAQIKVGAAGKSSAQVGAKGMGLPLPMPFGGGEFFNSDPNVVVQLINTEGKCWTSTFAAPTTNTESRYKAKVQ